MKLSFSSFSSFWNDMFRISWFCVEIFGQKLVLNLISGFEES